MELIQSRAEKYAMYFRIFYFHVISIIISIKKTKKREKREREKKRVFSIKLMIMISDSLNIFIRLFSE